MKQLGFIYFFILLALFSGCELFNQDQKRALQVKAGGDHWNVLLQEDFTGESAIVGNGWSQEFCFVSNDRLVLQGTNGDTGSGIQKAILLTNYRVTIRFSVETTNFILACYLDTTNYEEYAFVFYGNGLNPSHGISFWSTKSPAVQGYFFMETNTQYTGILTKREGLFKLEIAETAQSIQTTDDSYGHVTNVRIKGLTVDTPPDQTNHCYIDFIKIETLE